MIAFGLYLLLFLYLIYYHGFFGLFTDDLISKRAFAGLFLLKALAVPVFFMVYKKLYGGLELFDAGKFYHDASIISDYAWQDPLAYLKLMLGLQNDLPGSYDFVNYLSRTDNWDNGQLKDFLYNDNRVVIRLHSLFHFIAFKSYHVHALFNCLLSFTGAVFIYKAIKTYFTGKEFGLILVLLFIPALWFYTGAVLKEGIAIFILGLQIRSIKKLITETVKPMTLFLSLVLFIMSFLLKPYLLLFATLCFFLMFYLEHKTTLKYKSLAFVGLLLIVTTVVNTVSILVKGKSLSKAILEHQSVFSDAAKGGIFLLDSNKFVRLDFNLNAVKKVEGRDSVFTIKSGVPYVYWEHSHQQDTLKSLANVDTLTKYKLVYMIGESKSNIDTKQLNQGFIATLGAGLYYSLCYPFFFNARGPIHLLASFENLLILFSFTIIITGILQRKKDGLIPLVFTCFAIGVCLLAGLATPNSGAIFRYRSPVVAFIVLAAWYYLPRPLFKNKTKG